MKIVRVLNNNAAVVLQDKKEKVVTGKGIAFHKSAGDEIAEEAVEKVFVLSKENDASKFQELLMAIPYEYVIFGEKIITYAKEMLGKKLDDKIYIDLIDHIYAAVKRKQEGIDVFNALLWDIKKLYVDEFAIGQYALQEIEKTFSVTLVEDEAGFIAMHLINAELSAGNVNDVYEMTEIIQEVLKIVRYTFQCDLDENSVYYYRFMTHLRFFALRLIQHKMYVADTDDELFLLVKRKYANAYSCTGRIADFVQKRYGYELGNEEKTYLTIHINRLIYQA